MTGRHRGGGLSGWLYRVSSGWVVLAAIAIFVVFSATVLPMAAMDAEQYSNGAAAPDTSFWYSPDDLRSAAEAFGPEGRTAYVEARYTFDLVWPLVYGAFLATTLSWLLSRATSVRSCSFSAMIAWISSCIMAASLAHYGVTVNSYPIPGSVTSIGADLVPTHPPCISPVSLVQSPHVIAPKDPHPHRLGPL